MLKKENQRGFTLAEMLVSIAIIGIMFSIFVVNYRGANKKAELTRVAQKMVGDIRLMQNYSLGLKKFNSTDTDPPMGGWGIYVDQINNRYILFADKNNANHIFDAGEEFRTITFSPGITIGSMMIDAMTIGVTATVIFFPPDPITYINTDANTNISINLTNSSDSAFVTVNSLGLVEVN